MSDHVKKPSVPGEFLPILNPDFDNTDLDPLSGPLADNVLQLYMQSFLCTGSLNSFGKRPGGLCHFK